MGNIMLNDELLKTEKMAKKGKERLDKFRTLSNIEVKKIYTPEDAKFNYETDLGDSGEYPFTRGVYKTMYRGRLWTMRQFAGFGTAEDTNKRIKYLLSHGETGLSTAFDFPTLYGRDSDDPLAEGEVGKCGVAISSLLDMEILFDGIPLNKVSTSMTINGPAAIIWAFYLANAKKQGIDFKELRGTIQNDILKEYIAQKSWIFPPEPSLRLIFDTFEFGTKEVPKWNTISISGYHIREAGSTAVQELAFTLADGLAYVDSAVERGLNIDEFAPRLSFFFNAHNDFFEEIAKYRACRRIWAKEMKKRGAEDPRSMKMRFHTQTAGCSLTAQQPENNIIRTTIQALAAVLGGTQSLHTNSKDEALCLPTQEAATTALRTQQLIAHESGVVNTIDPLAGSYYMEWLTNKIEKEVYRYFEKIEEIGGVVPGIKQGYFQKEIAKAAYRYQREIETKKRIIAGINEFKTPEDDEITIPVLKIDLKVEKSQHERLRKLRENRDNTKVQETLQKLEAAARKDDENLMPYLIDAALVYATLGEIRITLEKIFGTYTQVEPF